MAGWAIAAVITADHIKVKASAILFAMFIAADSSFENLFVGVIYS
jgi:hypothetical protein